MDLHWSEAGLLLGIVVVIAAGYLAGPPERNAVAVDENGTTALDRATVETLVDDLPRGRLSAVEREGMVQVAADEADTADLTAAFARDHPLPLLDDLAEAERSHAAAARVLLEKYGLDAGNRTERPDAARSTLAAALRVSARAQEQAIVDLHGRLDATDNRDAALVYGMLLTAARNHLRVLDRAMERRGIDHGPTAMNRSEYREIVSGGFERPD